MMIATARLYLTADKARMVAQGDPEAATLYCVPGDNIPPSAVSRYGLVDGALGVAAEAVAVPPSPPPTPAKKAKAAPPNKEAAPPADKGAKQ